MTRHEVPSAGIAVELPEHWQAYQGSGIERLRRFPAGLMLVDRVRMMGATLDFVAVDMGSLGTPAGTAFIVMPLGPAIPQRELERAARGFAGDDSGSNPGFDMEFVEVPLGPGLRMSSWTRGTTGHGSKVFVRMKVVATEAETLLIGGAAPWRHREAARPVLDRALASVSGTADMETAR